MGYALTLISAVLYFFSFPPYSNGYLAFFSLIPFFFTLLNSDTVKKSVITGAIWGTALSVLFSIPLYYALITEYEFSLIFSSLLIIVSVYIPYGIIYGIYGFSLNYYYKKNGFYFPIIGVSLWLLIDYIMSITPFFMPWGYAGYTQVYTPFIQISDITGIHGVTSLVLIINLLLTSILLFKNKHYRNILVIIFLIICTSVIYGFFRVNYLNSIIIQDCKNPEIDAAIIQGNFSSNEKWDSKNTAAVINTYINMSKSIIENADLIVWPETVLNSNDKSNLEIITGMASLMKSNQIFITGATRTDSEKNVYNSVFASDNTGLKYIYDKKILFPFTETSFAGLSSGKFMDSPSIFNTGKGKPVFKFEQAIIGFTICFESIYPEYVRKIKNLGAVILINTANDSWFGNTYEPYMHYNNTIARAVENRFFVIRSSNNGISAIISPTGETLSSIELNKRDKTISTIQIISIPTFYSKAGDWIIIFSFLIIILSLIIQLKHSNNN